MDIGFFALVHHTIYLNKEKPEIQLPVKQDTDYSLEHGMHEVANSIMYNILIFSILGLFSEVFRLCDLSRLNSLLSHNRLEL